jgi:hypothetical protein
MKPVFHEVVNEEFVKEIPFLSNLGFGGRPPCPPDVFIIVFPLSRLNILDPHAVGIDFRPRERSICVEHEASIDDFEIDSPAVVGKGTV